MVVCFLFLIPNKNINGNSLYANIDKHTRLDSLPSPKIIFVGGSNLAYGLDSKRIQDSLGIPVVNMGLHAGFGLRFMVNEIKPSVHKGDIVVISPEYHHFFKEGMLNGEKVLVALVVDVDRRNLKYLSLGQMLHLTPFAMKYAVSKIAGKQFDVMDEGTDFYENRYKRNSFNRYGDENMHWTYPNREIKKMGMPLSTDKVSEEAIGLISGLNTYVTGREARLMVIPPAFMNGEYNDYKRIIDQTSGALAESKVPFSIPPERFVYPDSLFFNTIYHLNKKGVDDRTGVVISMLRKELNQH